VALVAVVLVFALLHGPQSAAATPACACSAPAITVSFSGTETASEVVTGGGGVDRQELQLTWSETQGFGSDGTPATPVQLTVTGKRTETDNQTAETAGQNCSGTAAAPTPPTSTLSADEFQSSSTSSSWQIGSADAMVPVVWSGSGDCGGSGASTPIDASFAESSGSSDFSASDEQQILNALLPSLTFPSTMPSDSKSPSVNLSGSLGGNPNITNSIVIDSKLMATASCSAGSSVAAVTVGQFGSVSPPADGSVPSAVIASGSKFDLKELLKYVKVGTVGWFLYSIPTLTYNSHHDAILTYHVKVPISRVEITGEYKAKMNIGLEFSFVRSYTTDHVFPGPAKAYGSFTLELSKKGYGVKAPVPTCPAPPGFESYKKTFDHAVTNIENYVGASITGLERALFDFAATGRTELFRVWAAGTDAFAKRIQSGQ
jgi:hypothetical protein